MRETRAEANNSIKNICVILLRFVARRWANLQLSLLGCTFSSLPRISLGYDMEWKFELIEIELKWIFMKYLQKRDLPWDYVKDFPRFFHQHKFPIFSAAVRSSFGSQVVLRDSGLIDMLYPCVGGRERRKTEIHLDWQDNWVPNVIIPPSSALHQQQTQWTHERRKKFASNIWNCF